MTGQQSDTQWYIARNGKQHGPLSDVEMRTFVSQGHLKPTDLIWRPGFADWRPAPAVFPFPSPDAAPPPPRPAPPQQRATTQQPRQPQGPTTGPAKLGPGHGAPGPAAAGPGPGMQSPAQERSFEPNRIRVAQGTSGDAPSRGRRVVGILALLVLIGGGAGWYLWQGGNLSLPGLGGSGNEGDVPTVSAPSTPTSGAQQATLQSESPASPGDVQALDSKFQKMPMWNVVKREFPEWYNEHLREVAALTAENKPQEEIYKQLAQALVQLRRQHANEALSASTEKLKVVANAFLDNLKSLSARSVSACYGFISQGETSPVVLELLQSPDQGAAVQAQVAAIFEAIADGRKSPTTHERAAKQDYEVLVQELSKLGWKEDDLKVFSNPSALAREPPARVCQMVQDWFVAHLSVQDQGTQERLLVETLKPVVSG